MQAPSAWGQTSYPARPIRIIVPFSPGGGGDLTARKIAVGGADAQCRFAFRPRTPILRAAAGPPPARSRPLPGPAGPEASDHRATSVA